MSLIVKDNGGTNIPPLEEGVYTAYSTAIIDLGTQRSEQFKKDTRKFRLVWTILGEEIDINGQKYPREVTKEYSFSLGERSTLRKDLQAWRGKTFTEEELNGFNLINILNKACQLQIIIDEKDGRKYNNLAAIMALPKGSVVEVPKTGYTFDTQDEATWTNYDKIPKWIQDRIKQAIDLPDALNDKIRQFEELKDKEGNSNTVTANTDNSVADEDFLPF